MAWDVLSRDVLSYILDKMVWPITCIYHDFCLVSLKYVYFIECIANKKQNLLSYGFYIVIGTCH